MSFSARSRMWTGSPYPAHTPRRCGRRNPPPAQLHRLGDGHEIADDALIRNGDRAAVGDLLFEKRDHGAVRPQHVAEAHGGKGRLPAPQALNDLLAKILGGPHDVGRVDRLVRGDQDDFSAPYFRAAEAVW